MLDTLSLFGFGEKGWGALLLVGVAVTLAVTATALVIGAILGSLVAWAKLSQSSLARIAGDAYTTIFRGVPELLIIFLFYFGGSSVMSGLGHLFGHEGFIGIPTFLAGALAVGVISGAYQAEVFRGAFKAVARGEIEAAHAIGMPMMMRFRRIIAPQVLRFAIPGLGNVWQLSIKDSTLVSVTGLAELMRTAQMAAGSTRDYFQFYVAAAVLYLVLTAVSNRVVDTAEARMSRSFRRRLA
jgi:octopine/nopaline transport system permease protein